MSCLWTRLARRVNVEVVARAINIAIGVLTYPALWEAAVGSIDNEIIGVERSKLAARVRTEAFRSDLLERSQLRGRFLPRVFNS